MTYFTTNSIKASNIVPIVSNDNLSINGNGSGYVLMTNTSSKTAMRATSDATTVNTAIEVNINNDNTKGLIMAAPAGAGQFTTNAVSGDGVLRFGASQNFYLSDATNEYLKAYKIGGTAPIINILRQPTFVGYLTAAQNVPDNVWTTVIIDTIVVNNYTMTNTSGVITIPTGCNGMYTISGSVAFNSSATGFRGAAIWINGAIYGGDYANAVSGVGTVLSMTFSYPLVATDLVEIRGFQNSGGLLALTAPSTQNILTFSRTSS